MFFTSHVWHHALSSGFVNLAGLLHTLMISFSEGEIIELKSPWGALFVWTKIRPIMSVKSGAKGRNFFIYIYGSIFFLKKQFFEMKRAQKEGRGFLFSKNMYHTQNMYSVSLIIPTLNESKVIAQTLSQFPPDFCEKYNIEIIVSDGGSSDNTVEIAQKYAHKVITHDAPTRQTISEWRNKGAEHASGDILLFLDADVIIRKKDQFFQNIQTFWASKYVFMTGNIFIHPEAVTGIDITVHHSINFIAFIMQGTNLPIARGELQIIKKSIFQELGGYRTDIVVTEDQDLVIRARKKGRVMYNTRMTVYESPRRFRKYGYPKVIGLWLKNYMSLHLHNKSSSKEWEVVR
jgi:cellulose synthase/poly-beta-1,6-N-acetylglucosamine synthase-like glycosyltransferase